MILDNSSYHPLIFHMLDIGAVTQCLWKDVLKRDVRKNLCEKLGLANESAERWLSFWASLHDLGKASPAFQGKWQNAREELRKTADLIFRDPLPSIPHGVLTTQFLREMLPKFLLRIPSNWVDHLRGALGGHHGVFPRRGELQGLTISARRGKRCDEVRAQLLGELIRVWQIQDIPLPAPATPDHLTIIFLAGLVSVADWIGSNEKYFPYAANNMNPGEYLVQARDKARQALYELGWLGWSPPIKNLGITDLFPILHLHGLRPLQEAAQRLGES